MSSALSPSALFPLTGGWLNIPRPVEVTFGTHFVSPERCREVSADLRSRKFLVASANLSLFLPGHLRQTLDEAVESALAFRGALPSSVDIDADPERTALDQVFRARALGATGLAIVLPPLAEGAGEERMLSEGDGRTLAAWLAAARSGDVVLLIDERDRSLRLSAPMELSTLAWRQDRPTSLAADAVVSFPEMPALPKETPEPKIELRAPEPAPRDEEPPPLERLAERVVDAAACRAHALELDKARGPKPIGVIEKLFGAHYTPVLASTMRGDIDATVRTVADTWRSSFEHSYREAFPALRVTGKRPPMVFDAPEIAARIARLNGARVTKLVLVDAMRFDLGERAAARLAERLVGTAVCVERSLLWSAIPTTTPAQLALIAKGPAGLADTEPVSDRDPEIARGRAVATLRRERVGTREVMKLDLVEARLRGAGAPFDERMESIADEVATVVARYVESMPPRTLVYLFGDHGFRIAPTADFGGTGSATFGGISPEEVLVPAQAWLVGGVH